MAQWERAGPITQRSVDRNYSLLKPFHLFRTLRQPNMFRNIEIVFSLQNLKLIVSNLTWKTADLILAVFLGNR